MEAVNRRETIFVFDGLRDYDLVSSVQLHPYGFAPEYPQRWVNNVYFDTHNLDTLVDHLAGMAARRKLRLRWYDATASEVTGGILQLKEKRRAHVGYWVKRANVVSSGHNPLCKGE